MKLYEKLFYVAAEGDFDPDSIQLRDIYKNILEEKSMEELLEFQNMLMTITAIEDKLNKCGTSLAHETNEQMSTLQG